MNNVPNLDCMSAEDLWLFWKEHHRPSRASARALFPDRPEGYIKATVKLSCYASNKATAIQLRLDGKIADAQKYEQICDAIYSGNKYYRLPDWAKW